MPDPVALMATPIGRVLAAEAAGATRALRMELRDLREAQPVIPSHVLQEIGFRSIYQVGIEIGVSIGVTDVAAARRLRDWLAEHVQEHDPRSLQARDRQVSNYLKALDR